MERRREVGIIIARFQVPELHEGHKRLLQHVQNVSEITVVLLGCAPGQDVNNPLNFDMRQDVVRAFAPKVLCVPLCDVPGNDSEWSHSVDTLLHLMFPFDSLKLYGGRDSFAKHYHGTILIVDLPELSGTAVRASVSAQAINSVDFRKGIIYAQSHFGHRLLQAESLEAVSPRDNGDL